MHIGIQVTEEERRLNVTQFVKTAHIEEINFECVVKFTQLLLLRKSFIFGKKKAVSSL